jgi:hypothetical protein
MDLAERAMKASQIHDREALCRCVEAMKGHGKRIIHVWDKPSVQPTSEKIREFFANIQLDCDLIPVIMGS